MKRVNLVWMLPLLLAACGAESEAFVPTLEPNAQTGRWYSSEQAEYGKQLFVSHCMVCHGPQARATPNWKKSDENGYFPPPPLNGSAHAWHHSLALLGEIIQGGGQPFGGHMPAFKQVLSDEQTLAVISGFQSFWDQATYDKWLINEQQSRN